LLRDRKMYVMPTPIALLDGVEGTRTMLLPKEMTLGDDFVEVGEITRVEVADTMTGYGFDFGTNELTAAFRANPNAGREHHFRAWRVKRSEGPGPDVKLKQSEVRSLLSHGGGTVRS